MSRSEEGGIAELDLVRDRLDACPLPDGTKLEKAMDQPVGAWSNILAATADLLNLRHSQGTA